MSGASETAEPADLAEAIRHDMQRSPHALNAYWYRVEGDRDHYAQLLRAELREEPVAILIVREVRFDNPNVILSDLVDLIQRQRTVCEEVINIESNQLNSCGLALLARNELTVAQASSPMTLPEWFAMGGGTTVSVIIKDLTWTSDASMNAHSARTGEIAEHLFQLEGTLLRRLLRVHERDHAKSTALLQLLRTNSEGLHDILAAAQEYRLTVTTPSAFRPSLREGRSLVARLWRVAQQQSPEKLGQPAKALAAALDLPDALPSVGWYESLASVLRRPSSPESSDAARRFARNLFMTIATACQFTTAAAHADSYGRYPVPLLRSISLDLRRSMDRAETLLNIIES